MALFLYFSSKTHQDGNIPKKLYALIFILKCQSLKQDGQSKQDSK